MNERYDPEVAAHYAAFRPPLHALILGRLLAPAERFARGLDVGSGTGYSAVALAAWCDEVTGVEPSAGMRQAARPHPQVTYREGSGEALGERPPGGFEVITFAGSLVYAKGPVLRRELGRVGRTGAAVLAYDFDLRLAPWLERLGLQVPAACSDYDHQLGLDDWTELERVLRRQERVALSASAQELAHLLLSDSLRHDLLRARFGPRDLHAAVAAALQATAAAQAYEADLYFARYRLGTG